MESKRLLPQSASEFSPYHHFNGIDLVKFICAYMVCTIHIKPINIGAGDPYIFTTINFYVQQYLCRLAVPFFFVTSGFLLYRKIDLLNPDGGRIKNYTLKLFRLFGIWSFLLFIGMKGHLWYLGALVLAVVIIYMLLKKGVSLRWIIVLAVIAYVIGMLGDNYHDITVALRNFTLIDYLVAFYEKVFLTTRNGVFFAPIYIVMGILFAHKRIVMKTRTAVIGFAVSMALLLVEIYLLKHFMHMKNYNMAIMHLPVIFFLFYIALHLNLKDRPIYGTLRAVGLLIFFLHMLINFFVKYAFLVIYHHTEINLYDYGYPITIIATTLICFLITYLSKKQKFRWLRYLYS